MREKLSGINPKALLNKLGEARNNRDKQPLRSVSYWPLIGRKHHEKILSSEEIKKDIDRKLEELRKSIKSR